MKMRREEIEIAIDSILSGAMETIIQFLPPTITVEDYLSRKEEIETMIHGVLMNVGNTIPVLYAQISEDGMGFGEFAGWNDFKTLVNRYQERVLKRPDSHTEHAAIANSTGPIARKITNFIAESE